MGISTMGVKSAGNEEVDLRNQIGQAEPAGEACEEPKKFCLTMCPPPHFYRQALLQRFSPYSALSLES